MKRFLLVAAALGLLLAVGFVVHEGFAAVGDAFTAVGWGLAVVVLLRAVQMAIAGLGWWCVYPDSRPPLVACVNVRLIREAINTLLPVAQIGGEIAGARLMTFHGIPGGLAGATVLVDMLLQVVTQFAFTLVGASLLALSGGSTALLATIMAGVAAMAVMLLGFFGMQRFGGFRWIDRGLMRLAKSPGWSALAGVANIHDHLEIIYADWPRLAAASAVHLSVWVVGTLEIYVALHLMGYPVSFTEALVIESLSQAVRASAFLVPGAFGIQEGGFIAICAVFAIPAPAALALSLVKRVPEVVLGLPYLVAWQAYEGRALMRRRRAAP
jgi:putative membrane protein